MAETKLISPGIPNYKLQRNLKLNDNYISNDGGDEGITIGSTGSTIISVVDSSSIELDGTDDYIDLDDILDDITTGIDKTFTLSAWIKPSNISGVRSIISKYKEDGDKRQFRFYAEDGILKLGLSEDGSDSSPTTYTVASSHILEVGKWYHVAATIDLDTHTYIIYKDGTNIGSSTGGSLAGSMTVSSSMSLVLDGYGDYMDFTSTSGSLVNDADFNNSETTFVVDNEAHFSAGDIILIDSELMSVSGVTSNNSHTLTVARGHGNSSAAAHDNNSTIYQVGKEIDLGTTNTVSWWQKRDVREGYPAMLEHPIGNTNYVGGGYYVYLVPGSLPGNDDIIYVQVGSVNHAFNVGTNFVDAVIGSWGHIAIVRDGNTHKVYINGQPQGGDGTLTLGSTVTKINRIGGSDQTDGTSSEYDVEGRMDEVAFFDDAKSHAFIRDTLYVSGVAPNLPVDTAGLVHYWKFEANTVDSDASNNSTGVLFGNATYSDDTSQPVVNVTDISGTDAHMAIGAAHGEDNSQGAADDSFAGTMDDVAIWNIALSEGEMEKVADTSHRDLGLDTRLAQTTLDALRGYWRLDEGEGNEGDETADESGGNNGTIKGAPGYPDGQASAKMTIGPNEIEFHVPYKTADGDRSTSSGFSTNPQNTLLQASAKAIKFNGSDEHIACGDVANTDGVDDLSVAFWVNFSSLAGEQQLVTKGEYDESGDSWAIQLNAGTLQFSVSDSITAVDTDLKLNIDTWYHIVVTYSNTSDALVFYLNGVSTVASGFTITGSYITIPVTDGAGGRVSRVVRLGWGYDANEYFNGKMQQVGIWNAALSASEVTAIYNNGRTLDLSIAYGNYAKQANLQGYWKLDETTGTSFTNLGATGATNNGAGTGIDITNRVDGNTISTLDSDYNSVKVYKELDIKNAALKLSYDDNDYATLAVANTGDLTISTIGDGTRDSDLTLDADGDIKLEPATGNSILLDGTVDIDAGVITGATSITSTTFVGALTGNASGTAATVTGAAQTAITSVGTLTGLGMVSTATTTNALDIQATALTTGNALFIDVNDSLTASATKSLVHIDYDKSGVMASSQTNIASGLYIDMADAATNNASSVVHMTGAHINIDSANAQGLIFQKGLVLEVAKDSVGDAATTYGIDMLVMDGATDILMRSSADTNDYCSISTTASGATTIATVDSGDAEAAHLTLDIQGDTIFKGDIADGTSTEVARIDSSASSLLMASGKKIEFNNANSFIYGVSDIFLTGARHLFLTASSGDVVIDAGGANITLQDDAGTYTPTAASDATTKAYVDANIYHFIRGGYYSISTAKVFIPMAGAEDLREGTTVVALGEKLSFICAYDGSFEKAYARSEAVCGSSIFGLHKDTGTNEVPSATAVQGVTVDMTADDTSYEFDFASAGTNTFSKGDIIAFSFDPTNAPNDVHFMIVLKFDVTT